MKNDLSYFPQNYADSRRKFLARVDNIPEPKTIGSWKIPGSVDDDLFVDHVWLPPTGRPETLFVITSGIHGPETYAGAAIQSLFLDEILPAVNRRNIGIFVAHAMNPYGFKYHERCTEAGVNLNRNFSVSGENYGRGNVDSLRLCGRFLERGPVRSLQSRLRKSLKMKNGKAFFDEVSMDELVKGIIPGQFERPEDVEFGGFGPEPQTKAFIEKLRELMTPFRDIVGFDLHTGLGDRNRLHLLTDVPGPSLNHDLFAELFHPEEDREFYVFTPPEAEGFYPVYGALNSAFGDLAREDQRACSITMEFGTLGHSIEAQIETMDGFLLAHQGRVHGYASEELERQVREADFLRFRPASEDWHLAVIAASRGLFQRVFKRAGAI